MGYNNNIVRSYCLVAVAAVDCDRSSAVLGPWFSFPKRALLFVVDYTKFFVAAWMMVGNIGVVLCLKLTFCTSVLYQFPTSRLTQFKTALHQLFREERANSLPLSRVTSYVNDKYSHETFDDAEIHAALHKMTQDNQVMMADDIVFLI